MMLGELNSSSLATLVVVDNAPSEESRGIVSDAAKHIDATYLPMVENTGPAGGIAAGMQHVLSFASDDDWIVTLDDDGLSEEPQIFGVLRDFANSLAGAAPPVGAVGIAGARFDRRRGRLIRPPDEELHGPVLVDYVGGNQLPTIRVSVARQIGVFDERLFFGFDDLDYCLRLRGAGFGVYASGPVWLAARGRFNRLGARPGRSDRRVSTWRRYYAVRNHIVVMRRYSSTVPALVLTMTLALGRPISDIARRRADFFGLLIASLRGCIDAWRGRLGRQVDPPRGAD
jgi:glycosyltransferase involved in cell wall biosynthesis